VSIAETGSGCRRATPSCRASLSISARANGVPPREEHAYQERDRQRLARKAGYARGDREARLFRLATTGAFQREQALELLNTAIDDGRGDPRDQRALEREIDAWDMSCRIMFMVQISS
jgi:hypothetical protein